jgi:hypothetical protein
MNTYEKDLNDLKEQILKDGDTLVSKRDLLERFCEMDKEYNGEPWNLLQILANINILVGEEPSEDVVEKEKIDRAIKRITKMAKSYEKHDEGVYAGLCLALMVLQNELRG